MTKSLKAQPDSNGTASRPRGRPSRDSIRKATIEATRNYCMGCIKYNPLRNDCKAFSEPFPMWRKSEDEECWAREESAERYRNTLLDIEAYHQVEGCSNKRLDEEIKKINKACDKEIEEAMNESMKTGFPWIQGGGGGEKADRTNKSFGPQQMKDNRFPNRKWKGWDS